MEFTIEPVESRSLVRRMAPWTLALGLFAGGGYGVYHYAAPVLAGEFAGMGGGDPALGSTEVQQLFGAAPAARETPESSSGAASDSRYGTSQYPSAAFAQEKYSTPSYDTAARSGNRYGAATTTVAYGGAHALPPAANDATIGDVSSPTVTTTAATEDITESKSRYSAPLTPPVTTVGEFRSTKLGTITPPDVRKAPVETPATAATPLASPFSQSTASAKAEDDALTDTLSSDGNPLRGRTTTTNVRPAADKYVKNDEVEPAARAAFDASAASAKPLKVAQPPADNPHSEAADSSLRSSTPARQPAPAIAIPPQALASASPPVSSTYAAPSPALRSFADEVADDEQGRSYDTVTPTPGIVHAEGAGRPGERSLEGTQTPSLTLEKLAPAEIQVGKKCTFAVRITNSGVRAAHNVQVRDETPQGTQLVGTAPKAAVSGSQLLWDLGTLSPGEERTVEMELMPTDEGELGSVATVSFTAEASAKARSTRPQLALRLSAPPRVMAGEMQVVEVELSNPGSGPATGVMLLETVPEGVTHEAGPALEFEVGTLAPGETRRLELNLHADKAGTITNAMTARSDANLEANAQCEFEIIAPALEVTVDGPQRRYLERPATYTLSVTNPGTAAAKEIQLVTQLPKGLKFISANNLGEYDAATHSVYWSLAELPPSEQGTVELTALAIEPGDHTLEVAGRAQQGLEDRTETQTIVEGLAALSFEVTAIDQMVEVGGETAYEVRVVNQGSKAATNVQVTAIVPSGLRAIGGKGDAPHAVEGDRLVFAPVGQLPPKGEAKFRVEVQGVRPGDQRLRIEVASDDLKEPMAKEEITRVYADE